MKSISFRLNGLKKTVQSDPDTPLLWVIRDELGLTGTKYGCGIAICGTCTVHLDGDPLRSCIAPISSVEGREVTTIEGLSSDRTHPLQQAWIQEQVPQCGYCQSGQIMQAAALLETNPAPSRSEILTYMRGNLCRCGAYMRIVKAIESAAQNG